LIALASKNDEKFILEILESDERNLLKPRYLSAWKINWENKADNIKKISEQKHNKKKKNKKFQSSFRLKEKRLRSDIVFQQGQLLRYTKIAYSIRLANGIDENRYIF
jgi:hypothetical protein